MPLAIGQLIVVPLAANSAFVFLSRHENRLSVNPT